jgi:hypothetical protein
MAKGSSKKAKPGSFRRWLLELGLPGAVLGVGLYLMDSYFWLGFALACAAGMYFIMELFRVSATWTHNIYARLTATAPLALLCLYMAWITALRSSPLNIEALIIGSGFSGAMNGIQWIPELVGVSIDISNPEKRDYNDLDLKFQADNLSIFAMTQLMPFGPSTSSFPCVLFPNEGVTMPGYINAIESGTGHKARLPFVAQPPATAYRIRCDKFPREARLQLVVALADFGDRGELPEQLPYQAFPPGVMTLTGEYKDSKKPVKVNRPFCDPSPCASPVATPRVPNNVRCGSFVTPPTAYMEAPPP